MMGALLGAGIVIFCFVAYFQTRSASKLRRHRRRHHRSFARQIKEGARELRQLARARSDRRRRKRPSLNPSLAETGGLPPLRPDAAEKDDGLSSAPPP